MGIKPPQDRLQKENPIWWTFSNYNPDTTQLMIT